jgi:asparagine synthase (glutamine-hydrolysing)
MNAAEIATNLVVGADPATTSLSRRPGTSQDVRDALEQAVLPALRRPPCLVAFSGGVDSSAVLAVAVSAASKHGLPLPIPATNRFPRIPEVDESHWQELVVAALRLQDWVRFDIDDELDLVGPWASPGLLRHGVVWPPNAHFLSPVMNRAGGGSVITGIGGDELFTPPPDRAAWVLSRQLRPRPSDIHEIGKLFAPAALRRVVISRQLAAPGWLSPEGRRLWVEALATELDGATSLWWGRSILSSWWPSRNRQAVIRSIQGLAGGGVLVVHPFMNADFVARLTASHWKTGFRNRAEAVQFILGDSVPTSVRRRTDKAAFFHPFVNSHSRALIERWDGAGVDERLVDVALLREAWKAPEVDGRSYCCLQSAWLAERQSGSLTPGQHSVGE